MARTASAEGNVIATENARDAANGMTTTEATQEFQCQTCAECFDPAATPICPACLVLAWLATESFVRPKHDPRLLPLAWESYRSVLTPNVANDPRATLEDAARNGTWYRDNHYDMFVHMTVQPLGMHPGSGIPEGKTTPEHALDSLLIAEANSPIEAHAFAVSREQFEEQVRAGEFEALKPCVGGGCNFLAVPGESRCVVHAELAASGSNNAGGA